MDSDTVTSHGIRGRMHAPGFSQGVCVLGAGSAELQGKRNVVDFSEESLAPLGASREIPGKKSSVL